MYRIGGIFAVVSVLLILLAVGAFFVWPYMPGSAPTADILTSVASNRLGGLMALDFLLLVSNLCGIPLFLALYVSLKRVNESYALIALALGLVGVVLIIQARPISELLLLSERYAGATTTPATAQYLAAGEAILAFFSGTAFWTNAFLGGLSLLTSSFLMLKSDAFGRPAAYVGIATNIAVCGGVLPVIGTALLFASVPGYLVWNTQLALGFFRLAARTPAVPRTAQQ